LQLLFFLPIRIFCFPFTKEIAANNYMYIHFLHIFLPEWKTLFSRLIIIRNRYLQVTAGISPYILFLVHSNFIFIYILSSTTTRLLSSTIKSLFSVSTNTLSSAFSVTQNSSSFWIFSKYSFLLACDISKV
jgi:hypothetical protein